LSDTGRDRGTTTIAPRVHEKIAGRAAGEVAGVGGPATTGMGRALGDRRRRPQVQARMQGSRLSLELAISVEYPSPLRATCEVVRRQVTDRLRELTGAEIERLHVAVVDLSLPPLPLGLSGGDHRRRVP
jgi:uncharacterized alkaline shock family protein YloU